MADADVELPQVGHYALTRLLHTSSTGKLYAGKQPNKKECAVRIFQIPLGTSEAKEAFYVRARQFKKLKHRNIVEILDFGLTTFTDRQDEYGYLVMQYAPGETLRSHLVAGEQLSPAQVKRFMSPLATALHYAHVNGILHANLHPANVLLGPNNDILLTDFALLLPGTSTTTDQHTAALPYMAPEQLQGDPVAASDQYALAVLAYELLCGRRPYTASERETLLYQQEHDPLPPPGSLNEHISASVEQVLLQALAVDPHARFPQAQAFADAYLQALMGFTAIKAPARSSTKLSSVSPHSSPSILGVSVSPHSSPPVAGVGDTKKTKAAAVKRHGTSSADDYFDDYISADDLAFSDESANDNNDHDRDSDGNVDDSDEGSKKQRLSASEAAHLHDTVIADLGQGGILSQSLPGYEERPAQIEMASLVARSLAQDRHAITEAGTGNRERLLM